MGDPGEHPTLFCRLSQVIQVQLFVTPWTAACQAPLSMGFSRKEYWSVLSCPPPGDPPDPGVEPTPLISPALAGGFFTTSAAWEAPFLALRREESGISLVVQWLRLWASNAGGTSSVPVWGTKIPHA